MVRWNVQVIKKKIARMRTLSSWLPMYHCAVEVIRIFITMIVMTVPALCQYKC
jgi:hypothetical protein